MQLTTNYSEWSNAQTTVTVTDVCPHCGKAIEPKLLSSDFYKDQYLHILYLTLFCPACKSSWVDTYNYDEGYDIASPRDCHVFKEEPTSLSTDIARLSPQGVRTYEQSLRAEYEGFDTLVGIGLRKSLEFILKDFLIALHPDEEENIRKNLLGKVITDYITDPVLLALAKSTAWLGNDETHYTKRHTDRDLQDLKKFLLATIRFIEYQLTILDAQDFVQNP